MISGEFGGFCGTSGREVFGIKIKYDPSTAHFIQASFVTLKVVKAKVRSEITFMDYNFTH